MVGFEKSLRVVKVIKDQVQYRSQNLLNLARGYFCNKLIILIHRVHIAVARQPWTDSCDCYFEYLIIPFGYLIIG